MIDSVELIIFLVAGLIAIKAINDSNLTTMVIGVIAAMVIIQAINTTTMTTLLMAVLAVYAVSFGIKPEVMPSTEVFGKSLKAVVLIILVVLILNLV